MEGLVEADYFCINSYGTKQYFHLRNLGRVYFAGKSELEGSGVKVTFIAEDGYKVEYTWQMFRRMIISTSKIETKYKMILAWEEDGREYDARKGNPFRLVVGQKEPGDVNKPYWVSNVQTIIID